MTLLRCVTRTLPAYTGEKTHLPDIPDSRGLARIPTSGLDLSDDPETAILEYIVPLSGLRSIWPAVEHSVVIARGKGAQRLLCRPKLVPSPHRNLPNMLGSLLL